METKAGEREGEGREGGAEQGWRSRACPSLFEVACSESGGLTERRREAILAHSQHCPRCRFALAELAQARRELLGATAADGFLQAQRAANEIAALLRHRLH